MHQMLDCACHDWLWLENNDSSEKTKKVKSSDAAKRSIARPNLTLLIAFITFPQITCSSLLRAVYQWL